MQRKNSVHDKGTPEYHKRLTHAARTSFRKADQDGGGSISPLEFARCLKNQGKVFVKSKKKGLVCGKSCFVALFLLVILLLSAPCLALTTDLTTSERRLATLFIKISSGTCTSSGRWMIKNIFDCALGHQELGGSILSATPLSSNYYAPACSQTPSGTYLNFNVGAANDYITADPCSQYENCICWTGLECANKDGAQPNTNECMCGTNICIPEDDGTFCVASSSSCTKRPGITCPVKDASSANTNSCQCGSNDCLTGNGGQPYCIDSLNFCGTSCALGKYRNVATSGGW